MGLVVQPDSIHVGLRHSCTSTAGWKPISAKPITAQQGLSKRSTSGSEADLGRSPAFDESQWSENYL
jgi:hypothetical protein